MKISTWNQNPLLGFGFNIVGNRLYRRQIDGYAAIPLNDVDVTQHSNKIILIALTLSQYYRSEDMIDKEVKIKGKKGEYDIYIVHRVLPHPKLFTTMVFLGIDLELISQDASDFLNMFYHGERCMKFTSLVYDKIDFIYDGGIMHRGDKPPKKSKKYRCLISLENTIRGDSPPVSCFFDCQIPIKEIINSFNNADCSLEVSCLPELDLALECANMSSDIDVVASLLTKDMVKRKQIGRVREPGIKCIDKLLSIDVFYHITSLADAMHYSYFNEKLLEYGDPEDLLDFSDIAPPLYDDINPLFADMLIKSIRDGRAEKWCTPLVLEKPLRYISFYSPDLLSRLIPEGTVLLKDTGNYKITQRNPLISYYYPQVIYESEPGALSYNSNAQGFESRKMLSEMLREHELSRSMNIYAENWNHMELEHRLEFLQSIPEDYANFLGRYVTNTKSSMRS